MQGKAGGTLPRRVASQRYVGVQARRRDDVSSTLRSAPTPGRAVTNRLQERRAFADAEVARCSAPLQ
jgi:hypothetical protein